MHESGNELQGRKSTQQLLGFELKDQIESYDDPMIPEEMFLKKVGFSIGKSRRYPKG